MRINTIVVPRCRKCGTNKSVYMSTRDGERVYKCSACRGEWDEERQEEDAFGKVHHMRQGI